MSKNIININERRVEGENEVPDVEMILPDGVYEDANWRDDIDVAEDETEEATSQIETDYLTFDNEEGYKSKSDISPEAKNKIIAFDRARLEDAGKKFLGFVERKAA
ncbi:hypothetical protein IK146_02615 [Candidatus Saccharibacteria bacterium]|nr:hypothetical protein [Candidatus Saccharibacteria bacterium]